MLIEVRKLSPILHLYISVFKKFGRDKSMIAESIRTVWLILERAGLNEYDLKDLCFEDKERVVICEEIIDFLVERL